MDLVLRVDSEDSTDNVFEVEIIIARKKAFTEEDTVPSPYPYKDSDISKYICKSVKSCLKVMLENEIPGWRRLKVKEITCGLSSAMMEAVRESFPMADIVNDRFHVRQLFNEAMDNLENPGLRQLTLQDPVGYKYRWS